jgi:hypothetical protein
VAAIDVVGSSPFLSIELTPGVVLCLRPAVPAIDAGVIDCDGGSNLGVKTSQDHNLGLAGGACLAAGGTIEDAGAPHPNVCNGSIVTAPSDVANSGSGALLIAPSPQLDTHGLPMELSIQGGACQPGAPAQVFAFSTASYRADISDAGNQAGTSLSHEELGQNFSCNDFGVENGAGRLVFTLGVLHSAGADDAILVFVLDD